MTTIDFTPITDAQFLSLDNFAIGRLVGCCSHTVMRERARRGLPKVRKPGSGRPRKAGTYDPTLTIRQNAAILGVTPQRAGQLKRELNRQTKTEEEWL